MFLFKLLFLQDLSRIRIRTVVLSRRLHVINHMTAILREPIEASPAILSNQGFFMVGTTTEFLWAFISFNLYSRIGSFSVSSHEYDPKPNFSHCLVHQSKFFYLLSFFCLLPLVCWENEVNELLDFVADIQIKYPCLNYYFLFNFHTRMMCRFHRVLFFAFVYPRKNPRAT